MRCRRDAVRRAIWHSWAAYKRHAWQADDLQPISRTGLDWNHAESTIFDALDTLALAGFKAEFEATAAYIRRHGPPLPLLLPTKLFEYNIRVIGGLLGAYSLSGDQALLDAAAEAADAVLAHGFAPAPGPIPWPFARLAHSGDLSHWR